MSQAPIIAVADDLTGAAEIAALGFRHGLESVVSTSQGPAGFPAQLVVFDTDSRLEPASAAAAKLSRIGRSLVEQTGALIYKKTDSVLRGAVRTEVEALAIALGRKRVILLPANPSMGRTIREGQYAIGGVPLDQTPFSRDPHHPAKSSSVLTLLGEAGSFSVQVKNATDWLPLEGLLLGNAESAADARAWAGQVTDADLPAGGAEFFSALLSQRGLKQTGPSAEFPPGGPTLIVSGTTSQTGALRELARRDRVDIVPLPSAVAESDADSAAAVDEWIATTRTRLAATGVAIVLYDGPLVPGPRVAGSIRHGFARCVQALCERGSLHHLIVEGGATAASIARTCHWDQLRLTHEWAQGVASLQPAARSAPRLTMKPGSYAWPETLWAHILRSRLRG